MRIVNKNMARAYYLKPYEDATYFEEILHDFNRYVSQFKRVDRYFITREEKVVLQIGNELHVLCNELTKDVFMQLNRFFEFNLPCTDYEISFFDVFLPSFVIILYEGSSIYEELL